MSLLKKCIDGATADREKNVFHRNIRRVPITTIDLELLLQKEKAVAKFITDANYGCAQGT